MEVRFNRLALADLAHIRAYIGAFNPTAAERLAGRLLAAAEALADHPLIGRPGAAGTREITFVPPYVMVYRMAGNRIRILCIWHGAQSR